jgi:hypothetical protein
MKKTVGFDPKHSLEVQSAQGLWELMKWLWGKRAVLLLIFLMANTLLLQMSVHGKWVILTGIFMILIAYILRQGDVRRKQYVIPYERPKGYKGQKVRNEWTFDWRPDLSGLTILMLGLFGHPNITPSIWIGCFIYICGSIELSFDNVSGWILKEFFGINTAEDLINKTAESIAIVSVIIVEVEMIMNSYVSERAKQTTALVLLMSWLIFTFFKLPKKELEEEKEAKPKKQPPKASPPPK